MRNNMVENLAVAELLNEVCAFDNEDREALECFSECDSLEQVLLFQARRLVQQIFDSLDRLRGLHSESTLQNTFKALAQQKYGSAIELLLGHDFDYYEFLLQAQIHIERLNTTRPDGHGRKLKGKLYKTQLSFEFGGIAESRGVNIYAKQ